MVVGQVLDAQLPRGGPTVTCWSASAGEGHLFGHESLGGGRGRAAHTYPSEVDVGEQLHARLWATDWRAMDEFLQGLHAEALAQAREAFPEPPHQRGWEEVKAHLPDQGRHEEYHRCVLLVAVALAETPKLALQWGYWFYTWRWNDDWRFDAVLLERISARGQRWASGFVTEASRGRVPGVSELYQYSRALVVHFDLPHPAGRGYREVWSGQLTLRDQGSAERWREIRSQQREWDLGTDGEAVPCPPTRDLSTLERMRREPHLQQLVRESFAAKKGIHDWDPALPDPVQGALVELAAAGELSRDDLVEDAWAVLGRLDSPKTHRAAADLLLRLVDTEELARSFPMLLGCLSAVHGSVTTVLLPAAITAAAADEDILALSEVIFARPEKRQRTDLLAALTGEPAAARWSTTTLVTCLQLAAAVDDLALSGAATRALERLLDAAVAGTTDPGTALARDEPDPGLCGLWREDEPVEPVPARFAAIDGGEAIRDAFTSLDGARAVDTPVLDLLVRWAGSDRDGLVSWLRSFRRPPDPETESFSFTSLVSRWAWDGLTPAWRSTMIDRVHHYFDALHPQFGNGHSDQFGDDTYAVAYHRTPVDGFQAMLAQEALARAGTVPYLLSRPSLADGTVLFDDLVARLRGYGAVECGAVDLVQALFRLEPVGTDRLAELEGLSLQVWADPETTGESPPARDAVALVRSWVTGGGLPPLRIDFESGRPRVAPVAWPAAVKVVDRIPASLLDLAQWLEPDALESQRWWRSNWGGNELHEMALMFPRWPALIAVVAEPTMAPENARSTNTRDLLSTSGRADAGVHHAIVLGLNAKSLELRLEGVDVAIALVASGRWDAAVHAEVTLAYLRAGCLGVARSVASWEQLALAGELRAIWPTVLAVVEAGAAMPRKPAGYAEVLSLVRRFLPAVPDPVVPAALQRLAASKGSTRSHLEARALVEAAR